MMRMQTQAINSRMDGCYFSENMLFEGRIVVLLDECNATLDGGAMALTDK